MVEDVPQIYILPWSIKSFLFLTVIGHICFAMVFFAIVTGIPFYYLFPLVTEQPCCYGYNIFCFLITMVPKMAFFFSILLPQLQNRLILLLLPWLLNCNHFYPQVYISQNFSEMFCLFRRIISLVSVISKTISLG